MATGDGGGKMAGKTFANANSTSYDARDAEKQSEVTVIIGSQWGDEGKGKMVDLLCQRADVVCRCQVRVSCPVGGKVTDLLLP